MQRRMKDLIAPCPMTTRHQRSRGQAHIGWNGASGRVQTMGQQGSAKVIPLPGPEAVFLNTSGGLTGGDVLSYRVAVPAGLRATATTQTAERVYRSTSGRAQIDVQAEIGADAHLDWLPQETILFDGAQARRRTHVTLAPGATCLMAEMLILGRAAMGEDVGVLDFHDWRQVARDRVPLHAEALHLTGPRLRGFASGLVNARAMASVALISPHAGDLLDRVRNVLDTALALGAASALPGRLVVRLLATDGWPLRQQLIRILSVLRQGPLPRVWQI
jgi:urease accessory protein